MIAAVLIGVGGVLLLLGLILSLKSNRSLERLWRDPEMAMPDAKSVEGKEKAGLLQKSDRSLSWGLFLTSLGVALQTWGSVLGAYLPGR